jgi:uncharacterized protein (DUF885 family)
MTATGRPLAFIGLLTLALLSVAAHGASEWIDESNRHANVLLEVTARYQPETATDYGLEGFDASIIDLKPDLHTRFVRDMREAIARLQSLLDQTSDFRVRQDLQIMVRTAQDQLAAAELEERLMLPYFDLTEFIYGGFADLLDDRVPKARQRAALQRLRRYTGQERGYTPVTELARTRLEERLARPELIGPWRNELEQDLKTQSVYLQGIRELFVASGLKGWQTDLKRLEQQLHGYAQWLRSDLTPRTRATNLLPREIYASRLRAFGVAYTPEQILELGLANFTLARDELQALAKLYAEQNKLAASDYQAVIRHLKQKQIPDDQLLPLYRERSKAIEAIVRRERIVTLPQRDVVIRVGTDAESAASPAPFIDLPRLIGNTGEPAEFVLPLSNPNAATDAVMDDFRFDAMSWTLTAHEARPGHDLQVTRTIENGASVARTIFAANSANLEGWALYAEGQMKPHLPLDGQIGSLQSRLLRAARAMLDPMLNLGLIDPASAKRFLLDEVGLSEPMAAQEVDRYTMRAPGQATSYLYGYWLLNQLRARAELALGERFDQLAFHDFIVSQGWLPLDMLQEAVLQEFIGGTPPAAQH